VTVRFTLLGDVEATRDGVPVDLGPARHRCVLAALLVDVNRVVPVEDLVDRAWPTPAPRRARETLRSYVSRLRGAVGTDGVSLVARSGGYLLRADPSTVDLHAFRGLVSRARAAGDAEAVGLYRQALALWRGTPFGGLDTPWIVRTRASLDAERREVDLHRADAQRRLDAAGRPHGGPARDRPPTVPAQLPPDLPDFAGRASHLAALDDRLDTGATVVAMSGPAGVGKTSLALHWAHRVRDRFADGQLAVNLRGFDADASAVAPAEALRGFLVALGVAPQRIPADLDEAVGLYRALTSDRRLLVLLDNATDADQVRPLLPGGGSCLTVVTSRRRITESADAVTVDLLSPTESRDLLARRLGPRVDAEPDAVADIVRSCGRLPLALAVVAARAATRPHLPLDGIAAELRADGGGLDAFATGDAATDVRSVLSWSYRRLSPAAGRVFRLLGRHLGPDVSAAAAASLTAHPAEVLRPLLAELVDAHLLVDAGGRYGMHDLLRAYAAELADDESHHGVRRLFDHYLHTAFAAAVLVDPHREPIDLPSPAPGAVPEPLATPAQAVDWFTAEHRVLLAATAHPDLPGHRWRLAWCLVNVLDRRGYWHDQAAAHTAALAAATHLGDPVAQAHSHRGLARAYIHLARRADARRHFDLAIACWRTAGDGLQEAFVLRNLAELMETEERYDEAVTHAERAIEIFQAADHGVGLSNTLHQLGWYRALQGDHRRALADLERALALLGAAGHRYGQAHTLDSLGYVHTRLGDHRLAIDCLHRALHLFEEEGDRYFQSVALDHLGDAHHAATDPPAAHAAWLRSLTILDDLGHPDAARVRAKLADLRTGL
jgi:hypothetical protein